MIFVSGVSMQPTIYEDDLAVVRSHDDYQPEDIVAYHVPQGQQGAGAVVIHRIIGGDGENGYTLQGDNRTSPDRWHPTNDDIIGSMWLHVPNAAGWIKKLYNPLGRGAIVGVMAIFLMVGHDMEDQGSKRRRRRPGLPHHARKAVSAAVANPNQLWIAAGSLALVGTLLAIGSIYAYTRSTSESDFVERLSYDHTASYEYTVHTKPATLYPDGVVGPITPADVPPAQAGAASSQDVASAADPTGGGGTVIFTPLAETLDLQFRYAFDGPEELSGAHGELGATLVIDAGESNWSQTRTLLDPTPFDGSTVSHGIEVEFGDLISTIDTIEEETGFQASQYEVSVIPEVHITGSLGATPIDDTYSAPFTMLISGTRLELDSPLTDTAPQSIGGLERTGSNISALGISLSVSTARWLFPSLASIALAIAAALVPIAYFGIGDGERARIRARYGSMVISVADGGRNYTIRRVKVASIKDLARLARRDGGIIFQEAKDGGGTVYFVDDGTVSYEYEVAEHERPVYERIDGPT